MPPFFPQNFLVNSSFLFFLQKFRLHIRKMPNAPSAGTNKSVALLRDLWVHPENCRSSTQQSAACVSQSGSPQSPLQLAISGGAGWDSCKEDDGKSERSFNWRSPIQTLQLNLRNLRGGVGREDCCRCASMFCDFPCTFGAKLWRKMRAILPKFLFCMERRKKRKNFSHICHFTRNKMLAPKYMSC